MFLWCIQLTGKKDLFGVRLTLLIVGLCYINIGDRRNFRFLKLDFQKEEKRTVLLLDRYLLVSLTYIGKIPCKILKCCFFRFCKSILFFSYEDVAEFVLEI